MADNDKSCSEEHLVKIATLIADWRAVSPFLGLTEADEIAILGGSPHSVPAQRTAMLRKWKQNQGAKATYKRLCRVFRDYGFRDLEEKVMQMANESSTEYTLESAEYLPSADHTGTSAVVFSQAPTMPDLMNRVARKTQTKWYEVGIQLNIGTSTLDAFEQQTRDQKRLYIKVFDQWKKEQKLPYTWDTIMNALKEVGENETVHDIRKWLRGETTSSDPSHSTASAAVPAVPMASSRQSGSQLGATPTILKLKTMKGADGKPLNIIKEISSKDYVSFGEYLLKDDNGTAVDLLKKDHIQDGAKSVTRAILQQWLTSTVAPRTYQHLIDCLRQTDKLDGLALLIEVALY